MRSATRCAGSRNCSAARAPVRPRRPLPSPCRRPAASGVCQGSVHASSLSRNSGNAPRESNWGASNRRRTESLRQAHTMQRLVQVHLSCTIVALSGARHRDVEPATQNIWTGVLTGLRPLACVKPRRATSMPLWRMGASADEEEVPVKKAIKVAVEAILEAIARVGDFYEKNRCPKYRRTHWSCTHDCGSGWDFSQSNTCRMGRVSAHGCGGSAALFGQTAEWRKVGDHRHVGFHRDNRNPARDLVCCVGGLSRRATRRCQPRQTVPRMTGQRTRTEWAFRRPFFCCAKDSSRKPRRAWFLRWHELVAAPSRRSWVVWASPRQARRRFLGRVGVKAGFRRRPALRFRRWPDRCDISSASGSSAGRCV